jgi:2-polyprenyl-6-methoxyphenol hydroxylase-like FAD-dependent oxidoreductase
VPDMLAHVDAGDDFYFDQINQIRMPCWSRGRVALVGDAGYCVSPLAGFGGSMALIGAGRLAEALLRHPDDHAQAFRSYELGLRPFVEEVQTRAATTGMALMFPATEADLIERDKKVAAGDIAL